MTGRHDDKPKNHKKIGHNHFATKMFSGGRKKEGNNRIESKSDLATTEVSSLVARLREVVVYKKSNHMEFCLLNTCSYYAIYYIHFEITGDPCNLIGSQQCDLFQNYTIVCSKSSFFPSH